MNRLIVRISNFLCEHERKCPYINTETGEVSGLLRLILTLVTPHAEYESASKWTTVKKYLACESAAE